VSDLYIPTIGLPNFLYCIAFVDRSWDIQIAHRLNVEIGTRLRNFISWNICFGIFDTVDLQCVNGIRKGFSPYRTGFFSISHLFTTDCTPWNASYGRLNFTISSQGRKFLIYVLPVLRRWFRPTPLAASSTPFSTRTRGRRPHRRRLRQAAAEPEQQAAADPERQAVVDPERQAAADLEQQAVADPERQAVVDPERQAAVDPGRQAVADRRRQADHLTMPGRQMPTAHSILMMHIICHSFSVS
jgi:hypothetical protein